MTNLPPTVPAPPTRNPLVGQDGIGTSEFRIWLELMHKRVGDATGKPVIGEIAGFETTVNQSGLASGGSVTLLSAKSGERWKVRDILLSGDGTNFSGGSGDRDLDVTDGTSTWTTVPAATLQSLSAARWGDTGTPFPSTPAHLTTGSQGGTDIVAQYSGGANDYTAGELTLVLIAERTA